MVERYSHTEATGGKKPRTEERSRLKDLPTAPGYEWLHEMDKRDDIIRIYVDERHDTMYMHQEGMSAIAKIVVSIIMSCISGGTLGILTAILTNLTINTIEARGDPVEGTKRTLSKEGLKSIGRSYVGQLLLDGDWGVAEGATWVATLQSAFMESLNTTLSDYLGRGIIDGDWRVNARRIGLDLVTSTAARFGAKQIGGWRKGTILGGGFMDYVSHKIMHGALAAATSAATARLDHVKGPERRKRIMGAASGAMMAEAVSEYMMNGAIANVEEKLNASGHAPDSMAYADLRCQLMKAELQQIKMFAQLAVTASAEAMRFDLNAAMFAANNALENDATRVFLALDRARVESQIQKILERDLAGKFYKGRGSSEQARAAIGDALRQQGATEEQIHQVLSGKVGRLIDATDVFHKDWLKADRTGDGLSFCGKLNDPSYLAKGLNLMSAAALILDECAREHPQLTQLTLSSIELAMGGVAGYVRTRVGDAVGLNDYVDGKVHQAESWLSSQLEGSLGMSAQKADMLASAGTFGMMFGFAGLVGNAKDKILRKAEDVTGKVKASLTPSRTRDVPTTKTSLDSLGLEGRAGRSTKPVRDMSDREYVQSLADRADKRFEGKGPRVGTDKHTYSQRVHERYQRMTGERTHMEAEKRFFQGREWASGKGTKGSSRADMYNRRTNEAYDYKFGDARLSARQQQKYEANLPRNSNGPAKVHETKPSKQE